MELLRRRGASILLLAVLAAGCGDHAEPTQKPAPAAEKDALVVVGDSLAAGRFADTQEEAFPQRVAAAMKDRLELIGIPGATTAQLTAQAMPGGGKVVVVEAGTNDYVHQTSRHEF